MSDARATHYRSGREYVPARGCVGQGDDAPVSIAGYHVDNAGVVCHECYDITLDAAGLGDTQIPGRSVWNAPGVLCDECGRYLDTFINTTDADREVLE